MDRICGFISKFEISDWIALLGVLSSGLFSCLLLISTYKIGKRQTKLQEDQNKLQENQNRLQENQNKMALNQMYRSLYGFLLDVKGVSLMFFYYLESGILSIVDEQEMESFKYSLEKLNKVQEDYKNHKIDIELQLSDYSMLNTNIDILLSIMESMYSNMHDLQLTLEMDLVPLTNLKNDMLKKMIATINNEIPGYYLKQDVDINAITNQDTINIMCEMRKLLIDSSWELDGFVNKSDDDIIKHLMDMLAKITDNINIERDCKQFVYFRDKIFKENNILEVVKNKIAL